MPGDNTGAGSANARELLAASTALLQCGQSTKNFVNESEAIQSRFERALNRVVQAKYSDEREILDSLGSKEQLAVILVDIVRNRPPLRGKVVHIRRVLSEKSPQWARAWQRYRQADAVLGEHARTAPTSQEPVHKKPIPFALELFATLAILPFLLMLLECDCRMHQVFFVLGLLLVLLWAAATFAHWRGWLLRYFAPGNYAVSARIQNLGTWWYPSRIQLLNPPSADTSSHGCTTFGRWWRTVRLPEGASVVRNTDHVAAGNECALSLTCSGRRWANIPVTMNRQGAIFGLPGAAKFDGSVIMVEGRELQAWVKLGCWRWEFVSKVLSVLAAVGVITMIVAAALSPGILCNMSNMPLTAVFLLDGSASVSRDQFVQEQMATKAMIIAFDGVDGHDNGMLHLALVQFSSDARVEVPMTDNPSLLINKLDRGLSQMRTGTDFAKALRQANTQLLNAAKTGPEAFDICVLITDGEDTSGLSGPQLQQLVGPQTAIFGVFVGSDAGAQKKLRAVTKCGRAEEGCDFFAAVADFGSLRSKAEEVARTISIGSRRCSATSPWSWLWLLALLPALLWWLWLMLGQRQLLSLLRPARGPTGDWRIHMAGRNEGRGVLLTTVPR
eukprot:TRINITY_DN25442_c0_g1_i1.p1 TRINITY_DN25442_c0_g1~~TRINITY_DN25442_c0_g1_i1.p1  ORF type:complete len:615 (-),score=64.77 TRINITY_DN25442_c0_g1_i1:56-1900(-)